MSNLETKLAESLFHHTAFQSSIDEIMEFIVEIVEYLKPHVNKSSISELRSSRRRVSSLRSGISSGDLSVLSDPLGEGFSGKESPLNINRLLKLVTGLQQQRGKFSQSLPEDYLTTPTEVKRNAILKALEKVGYQDRLSTSMASFGDYSPTLGKNRVDKTSCEQKYYDSSYEKFFGLMFELFTIYYEFLPATDISREMSIQAKRELIIGTFIVVIDLAFGIAQDGLDLSICIYEAFGGLK
ncbi:hypothetical protein [Microbulbifer sp. GL-2]|uniref:hypothetical protein n=1 Tax=Microbulbifer sp. GL-2 TaxID=2591606 RepID=UPI001163F1AA|nr:hypothetical protein [Microbulbifer sp. GL-2]BBM02898.1 hypothetical protein GL2_29720 [Microbulbifer sp. GL-2]